MGGEQLTAALRVARRGARFALVGALAGQLAPHLDGDSAPVEIDTFRVIAQGITLRGYSGRDHPGVAEEWAERFGDWLRSVQSPFRTCGSRASNGPVERCRNCSRGGTSAPSSWSCRHTEAPPPCVRGERACTERGEVGMRIGDAAAAAGTTPRALRFYEERGLLTPPPRTATGQRRYRPDDMARVRVIRELLALGLTVEDLRGIADRIQLLVEDPQRRCADNDPATRLRRGRTPVGGHRRRDRPPHRPAHPPCTADGTDLSLRARHARCSIPRGRTHRQPWARHCATRQRSHEPGPPRPRATAEPLYGRSWPALRRHYGLDAALPVSARRVSVGRGAVPRSAGRTVPRSCRA